MVLIYPINYSNSDIQYGSVTRLNKITILLLLYLVIRNFTIWHMQAPWWDSIYNLDFARLILFFMSKATYTRLEC